MTDTHVQTHELAELTDAQLDVVTGGSDVRAEAQIFEILASTVREVVKNFGGTLQTAARGG